MCDTETSLTLVAREIGKCELLFAAAAALLVFGFLEINRRTKRVLWFFLRLW